ncbi:hypothetical protein [Ornithinibacillus californiensis]|uniref:hypothetical protein n=1 Tax=Ornithinibacillus californiensis TaxID=161536 RepID=UPI00064DF202|nr:hypothetical protein [Ornithinibacillus californiensis]
MKLLSTAIAFLGICMLFSVWILSNAISYSGDTFPSTISVHQPVNEQYELVVNDEWIYLYNKNNGQVWRKLNDSEAYDSWETVIHFRD